jgi:hypothetical protein
MVSFSFSSLLLSSLELSDTPIYEPFATGGAPHVGRQPPRSQRRPLEPSEWDQIEFFTITNKDHAVQ